MSAFHKVRISKFRHMYGKGSRRDKCYEGMRVSRSANDCQFCAVNPKFIAVVLEVAGGGAFQVISLKWMGKIDYSFGRISGHRGPINDIKWNPFNDNVIASCSDDGTICLWYIPDNTRKIYASEPLCQLIGHSKRVTFIEWNPVTENVLAGAGTDFKICIWNVSTGEILSMITCHETTIYSMSFNRNGSLLATTSRDTFLRIINPRNGNLIQRGVCHDGKKASKVVFLRDGLLATCGFSHTSHRQFAIWSQNELSTPLFTQEIDASAGILFPFYDYDLNILFIAGKGDGNIRYYEILDSKPYVLYLNEYQSTYPQHYLAVMPKRGLDTSICEVFRFYKVYGTQDYIEPVSLIVPRRAADFPVDLYPPTAGPTPALSPEEWILGAECQPVKIFLKKGISACTNKPVQVKTRSPDYPDSKKKALIITADRNNERKFRFLSQITRPDYRQVTQRVAETKLATSPDKSSPKMNGVNGVFTDVSSPEALANSFAEVHAEKSPLDETKEGTVSPKQPEDSSCKISNENLEHFSSVSPTKFTSSLDADRTHHPEKLFKFFAPKPTLFNVVTVPEKKVLTKPGCITPSFCGARSPVTVHVPSRSYSRPESPRISRPVALNGIVSESKVAVANLMLQSHHAHENGNNPVQKFQDGKIEILKDEVAELNSRLIQLENELRRKNEDITSLRFEIEWKDQRIKYLEEQLCSTQVFDDLSPDTVST